MATGRLWNVLFEEGKTSYVMAVHDATVLKLMGSPSTPTEDNIEWAAGFVIKDYMSELDVFYKDLENIRIPIPLAIRFCTTKLKGQTKKDDLEHQLMALRKLASIWK